jgi:hypothetical protein
VWVNLYSRFESTIKGNEMSVLKNYTLIGISMLCIVGLAACDKPGPAETAGKKIDQTLDQAGDKIDSAIDKAGDKLSK